MVFWLIFSIVGVQFFGGKFFRCVNSRGERVSVDSVTNKTECIRLSYRWVNANINFDNVLNGLIALFQVVSAYLFNVSLTPRGDKHTLLLNSKRLVADSVRPGFH